MLAACMHIYIYNIYNTIIINENPGHVNLDQDPISTCTFSGMYIIIPACMNNTI